MKTLTVRVTAELQVPDDWTLADHASGMTVLKIGDQFVDFDIAPLSTRDDEPDSMWTDDDETLEFVGSHDLERLAALPAWALADDGLSMLRTYRFADFSAAFAFMTQVALAAEKANQG